MKTKIVYVVVCDKSNYYLEQAILSILSLKINNPTAEVYIVSDTISYNYILANPLFKLVSVKGLLSIDVPNQYNNKQKSRFLKTKLRNLIEGDYLFIDTDTIITSDIGEIDYFPFDIGAVLDKHISLDEHPQKEVIEKFAKIFKWSTKADYFNSGIMYVKDNNKTRKFYDLWHFIWKEGSAKYKINIDQPSLAKANEKMDRLIEKIPGVYNCQINDNGMQYLYTSKILHYFASNMKNNSNNPFLLAHPEIYEELKNKGLTERIQQWLTSPKEAFMDKCLVVGGKECDIYSSPLIRISRKVSHKIPIINKLLDKISILRKFGK